LENDIVLRKIDKITKLASPSLMYSNVN
jgi:hypothetical protein